MSNEEEQREMKQTESEEPTWNDVRLADPAQDGQAESSAKVQQENVLGSRDAAGPATFSQLEESRQTKPAGNLDMIMDIPVVLSVELGRTKMLINDILQLGQGSIIELQKMAGEPMDRLRSEDVRIDNRVSEIGHYFDYLFQAGP